MYLRLFEEELHYLYLERTVKYGGAFSKRSLGIIRSNHWVKDHFYFMYHNVTKHVIVRNIALLSNSANTEIFNI